MYTVKITTRMVASEIIDWIDVLTSDGSVQRCSGIDNADLFKWTIGGMGLTGVIIRAAIPAKYPLHG